FSSRRRHTRFSRDWSSDVCSSDLIRGHSHRNVIQGNEFFHSIFDWSWDAVKETKLLERGGIYFGGDPGGRGNVIRRNSFHDSFEIGRASCRERVERWVVAVASRNK